MKQPTIGSPYRVPPEPSRWSAIGLAVAVHAFLLAFLWVGISWQNNQPAAVEAEVWDMKVQTAAPPPPPPAEAPEPEPEPEPAPAPKVVEQPAPPAPAPDIKLEQEKKRKEELKKELAEQKKRDELKAKEEAKKEADKKAKEEAAKKEAERKKQEELAKKEKEKAEKLAKAKLDAQKKELAAKQRAQEMQRMLAQAGAGTSGTAAKSTAPKMDSGYVAAITAKIKSMTTYAGNTDVPGNPTVVFKVEQLPTGEIISVRKVKSSGMAEFDDAVERGINKSSPLPKKKDGTVERSLEVSFHMKDLN